MVLVFSGAMFTSKVAFSQTFSTRELLIDLTIVEKESAAAKEVRLKWISQERNRVQGELKSFSNELVEIEKTIPHEIQPRSLLPNQQQEREREQTSFNDWASTNDPSRRFAIIRGTGLNALLRVLGPIAHYRRLRTGNAPAPGLFPSLSPGDEIRESDWSHYRMNPATSSGQVEVRLNQMPLAIESPPVLMQIWPVDCVNLRKTRDLFVSTLSPGSDGSSRGDHAELLDKSLALLQAKIQKKKRDIPHDASFDPGKRVQIHRDLQEAKLYLESLRATVQRLKNVPGDYRVVRFAGGSIEDFLDFCYTNGMVFSRALPADEECYMQVYRRMKDYAHDIQYLEDWRSSVEQRIRELNDEDRQLVWRASVE